MKTPYACVWQRPSMPGTGKAGGGHSLRSSLCARFRPMPVDEMGQTLRLAQHFPWSLTVMSRLKPELPEPVPCACTMPALRFLATPCASACRPIGMGAPDSFSACTRSGASLSSSGPL